MVAFATLADFEARVGKVDASRAAMVETLLEDAADELRGMIGQEVWPRREVTVTLAPSATGRVVLPQVPVVAVASVTDVTGATVDVIAQDGASVTVGSCVGPVTVTFTFGHQQPPRALVAESVAMVAMAVRDADLGIGPTSDVQTLAVDDFRVTFKQAAVELLTRHQDELRRRFGHHAWRMLAVTA